MLPRDVKDLLATDDALKQVIGHERLDAYVEKLSREAEVYCHYVNGCLAGFVAFYCNDSASKRAFISMLLVAPAFRSRGVGSCLVEAVLGAIWRRGFLHCGLEVRESNVSALSLYRRHGFVVVERRDGNLYMSLSCEAKDAVPGGSG